MENLRPEAKSQRGVGTEIFRTTQGDLDATGIQGRSRQVDQVTDALTVETHIMIGEDGWPVPFGRAPDHYMQKAIRRLNVMFLEETDGTGHSGSWRMRWWSP